MSSPKITQAAARQLLKECETMLSRINAILAVDAAIDALESADIFGAHYGILLREDAVALSSAIEVAYGKAYDSD